MEEGKEDSASAVCEDEQQHLRQVHHLQRVEGEVFIRIHPQSQLKSEQPPQTSPAKSRHKACDAGGSPLAQKREKTNSRQGRCRQRHYDAGEVQAWVPREIVEEWRAAGGVTLWYEQLKAQQVVKRVVVKAPLSERKKNLMKVGWLVSRLAGWRAKLVWRILRVRKADS